ncbi:hypothetical protein CL617_02935 [archaeon]|nr:hypothetical protein [archaeon]|tara:strand:+ start:5236 stop:5769 length:534 start_codon:yes stop_codon:yes gene_type:complete
MIYPKNQEHFKKLITFSKKIISICKDNKITSIIYGSFAHFYYTKDKNMRVNDIDILIPKNSFPKMIKLLEKNKIKFKYIPEYSDNKMKTIIVKKGKLKVEIDETGTEYKTLNERSLSKDIFNEINFDNLKVKMITLKQLEDIYLTAYKRSKDDKPKILKKIKHLEKFLGRKLKRKHQ